jgi:NitT/TauT family transport system substrate-binding protein
MTSATHSRCVMATAAALIVLMPSASAQDVLKVASADRGAWELAAPELGQRAGVFKKHGIVLDFSYTQSDDETFERVLSGRVDVGLGVETVRVLRAYVRGAPVRIIGANVTGASNYWYVLTTSPIRAIQDLFGKSIAYAANGLPSHYDALDFNKEFRLNAKLVPTGGMTATFKELAANRVDVGWGAPPFGIDELEQGKIRIIGRANEVAKIRGKTISVLTTNATTLAEQQDVFARFMDAYRESIEWMYTDPAALKHYAEFAGVSEEFALRLRDEFFAKSMLLPDKITGLKLIMKDANLKLSRRKVSELVQIPSTAKKPFWKSFLAR